MTDIDDRLRDHYRGMLLNSNELLEITNHSKTYRFAQFAGMIVRSRAFGGAIAAVALLTITFGMHQYGTSAERTLRTLNEAAMNHSTRLQLEFESNNINEIDQQMSQLQFKVALPAEFDSQFHVIGARYCTINGELAAHVKFVDKKTNKQMSLFMARSAEGLRTIDATNEQINGVNVKLWSESGLFYAMASRSPLI